MKKLLLFLLLTASTYPQSILLLDKKAYWLYDSTTVNAASNIAYSSATISSNVYRTKSNKNDTLATKKAPQRWMTWWKDSTEQISNGTFDSDSSGWDKINADATLDWVASGGGFTGAVHVTTINASTGMVQDSIDLSIGKYRLKADIYIDSINGSSLRLFFLGYLS